MRIRWVCAVAIVAVGMGGWAGFSLADETQPNQDEMMAMLIEMHKPGPAQAAIDSLAGEWSAKTFMHMKPGEPPVEGKASARNEWIHDGRMMRVSFQGEFMGEPFQGEGHLGHDNYVKEYQSTWTDSMSSNIFTSTGSYDAATKKLTMEGMWKSPMGDMPQRMVYTLVGPDEYTLESYGIMGDQAVLQMRIVFSRKAAAASNRCCPKKKMPYTGTRRP
ncbi:MAG: DUF1579 family protein [Planctomycetota bacterium]|nr:DUF1579 family protein [Planctomycetota bacterium]